jgi:Zn-dependent protease with chaperone function
MARVGELDFSSFVTSRREQRAGGAEGAGTSYAYESDHRTRAAFEAAKPVELAVSAAVRLFRSAGKAQLLGSAVKVGPTQFPRVDGLARECAHTLGIAPPTVYIVSSPSLNAATYGTDDDSFVLVHSALVDHLSDDELRSVIGHECGHIHNRHVVYLTAMHMLTTVASAFVALVAQPALLALAGWSRRAEVTCDRAGLLCSKDLGVSTKALAKLALGSTKLYEQLNLEAFLAQHEEGKESVGRYSELRQSHPFLPKRILALRVFAESEVFQRHVGLAGGEGLAMPEVDKRVHEIIKVVG